MGYVSRGGAGLCSRCPGKPAGSLIPEVEVIGTNGNATDTDGKLADASAPGGAPPPSILLIRVGVPETSLREPGLAGMLASGRFPSCNGSASSSPSLMLAATPLC